MNYKRGRDQFVKFKKFLFFLTKIISFLPLKIRINMLELFRFTKGIKGVAIRYILLKSIAVYCGDNVSIHPGIYLLKPENLNIGSNVSIHPMSYIDSTGGIVIGNDVSIAHNVTVMSTSHQYENANEIIKDQGLQMDKTVINDNVWVGAKATILAGVSIASGSIIAANAVVNKNVEKYSVIAGVPGRVIKKRAYDNV